LSVLLDAISKHQNGLSEFQLLEYLNKNQPDFFEQLGERPSLYKKHFLLFHRLYKLKAELLCDNQTLQISAMQIKLMHLSSAAQDIGELDPLQEFYLDRKNLALSTQEIEAMQRRFWQKYLSLDKKAEAIKLLGLQHEPQLTLKQVKQRFNLLAQQHHPDKGGDPAQFVLMKQAYDDLRVLLS